MDYNDYNIPQGDGQQPIEVHHYTVENAAPQSEPPKKKKKGGKARWIALCLVCALVGGVAGGAGVAAFGGMLFPSSTTIYESGRTPTVVNVAKVDGRTALTVDQVYEANLASVVGVNGDVTTNFWGQTVRNAVAGSGFVITSDGYILTNYHVIDGVEDLKVTFADGTSYDAVLVGGEEANDVAVLKIDATGLTPVVVGNSSDMKVGEQVVAIGNPLGELTFTLTAGYVSALDRNITMSGGSTINVMQTDAAINSGNSGGPLFNIYGEVIGITNAKYSNNGDSSSASIEGVGFAIPINDVIDMVTDIMEHGYVTGKPFLGVQVEDVDSAAQQYGVPAGASVKLITPGYAAEKAGLKEGDIVTAINDTEITSASALTTALKEYKAGDTVSLTVYRNGESQQLQVTLDEKTAESAQAQNDYITQRQEEQQQQQQQQQGGNYGYGWNWPFGW
jgi:serine protease Do